MHCNNPWQGVALARVIPGSSNNGWPNNNGFNESSQGHLSEPAAAFNLHKQQASHRPPSHPPRLSNYDDKLLLAVCLGWHQD
jgi:hypothetical protein